jgi:hypothetical protein
MKHCITAVVSLCSLAAAISAAEPPGLFPFVLPWDDATEGITNISGWLDRPAGKRGPVHAGEDGHFYVGDRRIRFFGVNFCFGGCLPSKEDAPKIAARLAKFGINVIRFHHMDGETFPTGIRDPKGKTSSDLSPEALDRLDFFIAELTRRGIYANLNLLVWRPFRSADGLPAEIEQCDRKASHVIGFFDERERQAQEVYARNLLQHRNPYTRRTYAEDPAVAFVEINNENGLIHAWIDGQVDALPEVFLRDLQKRWNAWLHERHQTTAKLRQAWSVAEKPLGDELLKEQDAVQGWVLEKHEKAEASQARSEDVPVAIRPKVAGSVQVTVTRTSTEGWHMQYHHPKVRVEARQPYTLEFWARADAPRSITAVVQQDHDPWQALGLEREVRLTPRWQQFRFVFEASRSDDRARVIFSDLARATGSIWLAGVSLRPGGTIGLSPEEDLEKRTVALVRHDRLGDRTAEGQRDWLRFLWQTEQAYWDKMRRFLKEDIGVRGVVIGTIVGCSTPNLMAGFDAVDTHAYWHHPEFPGRPWDAEDWIVPNRTMVNEPGGVLPVLALCRVAGKPHCVSEYNHPAPNTYGSEAFLLLAAYAALQDWDAIYAFAYSHSTDWDARRIGGFFDIGQHPTKMATLPAAAALFLRGDVQPAKEEVRVGLSREQEIDGLRTAYAWSLVHGGHAGLAPAEALLHRVAVVPEGTKPRRTPPRSPGPRFISDTGELTWDLRRKGHGVVLIDTPKSKAVIGHGGGQRFHLGGVVIDPGDTLQDGWSVITITAMEGLIAGPGKLLVTTTGTVENTGMGWKSDKKDSVGSRWGRAPSLVEGVPVRLTLPAAASRVRAWILDERGQRRAPLRVQAKGDQALIVLAPEYRSLWYEIAIRD